jgi:PAS domain S-box-containing protein
MSDLDSSFLINHKEIITIPKEEYDNFEELEHFFDLTLDLFCIANSNGYFQKVNQSVCDVLGYSKEELFANPIQYFVYEPDKKQTEETRSKIIDGKALFNFENRYLTKFGQIV